MEFKGTKGKWEVCKTHQTTIIDCRGFGIAQKIGIRNSNEWKANALLISKAPEMLEMLKDILISVENSNIPSDIISMEKIEILIKEATEFKNK